MWFFILSALLGVESPVLKAGSLACRGAVILPPAQTRWDAGQKGMINWLQGKGCLLWPCLTREVALMVTWHTCLFNTCTDGRLNVASFNCGQMWLTNKSHFVMHISSYGFIEGHFILVHQCVCVCVVCVCVCVVCVCVRGVLCGWWVCVCVVCVVLCGCVCVWCACVVFVCLLCGCVVCVVLVCVCVCGMYGKMISELFNFKLEYK